MLLVYFSYIMFLFKSKKEMENYHFARFVKYFFNFEYILTIRDSIIQEFISKKGEDNTNSYKYKVFQAFRQGVVIDLLILSLGLFLVIISSYFLIEEVVWLAELLHVPNLIIGITFVAVGTSLPELMVSISSAKEFAINDIRKCYRE